MFLTKEEDTELKEVDPDMWSKGPADVGLMKGVLPIKITPKTSFRPHVRQYTLRPDAEKGIEPTIMALIQGVIVPCPDSPVNTPLFPVRKAAPSIGWRMVVVANGARFASSK